MTLEFQKDILKFLTQKKKGRKYLGIIESDLFSDGFDYLAYSIVKSFYDKYHTQPTKTEALELLSQEAKEKSREITPEIRNGIETSLKEAFRPYVGNEQIIADKLIEQYQIKLTKDLFKEKSIALKDATGEFVEDMHREITRINKLSAKANEEKEQNRGRFLIKEHIVGDYSVVEGNPTCFEGLNKMTGIHGFASPQLIVIMSGPKRFKTGTLLTLALGYTRNGSNVYYVDTENGQDAIEDRVKQAMLKCTHRELVSHTYDSTLEEIVGRFKHRGGDFRCDFYPAQTKTIMDVEEELDFLEEEYNWKPDLIIWDNLDNLVPTNKYIKEKRLQIQAVYFEAIALQKRRDIFGITSSQVGRNAVDKRIIEMTDFAEDFGKAANCHAAFAVCADEFEMSAGVRRIVPVVQRQGVDASSNVACYVSVDASRMSMEEISFEEWRERVDREEGLSNKDSTGKKNRPPRLRKKIKDA